MDESIRSSFDLRQQGVKLFALGLLLLMLVVVGVPASMVALMSFRTGLPGEGGALTLANFANVYSDAGTYEVLLNTLLFATGTVAVALLFAVPIVWLLSRTDIPLKGTIYILMTVGVLIPVFLRTISLILLFSPRIGLINQWATRMLGLDQPLVNIYNLPGMAFIQGISFVPAAFFMLVGAYRTMDPSLEEAAYTSGISKFQTFLRINIPITLPAISGVMVYLFMTAIAVFEIPAIIGLPARILVLSSMIYTSTNPPIGLPRYGVAGAYGSIMLLAGLILAYLYFRTLREGRKYAVITGRGYRPREIALGHWKWVALSFIFFYLCFEVFVPFFVLTWTSLLSYIQLPSIAALSSISLKSYKTIFLYAGTSPFVNTAILIIVVPSATMLVSVLVSWVVIRTQVSFRGALDTLAFIPHAIPTILIAVGLAYFSLAYRNIFPVYGGLLIIIIAHTISWIAYGTRTINSVMIQVHKELEEAGKVSGLSAPQIIKNITVPLIASGIFNSWIWLAMLSYREVTMALTLATGKNRVISTVVFEFWSNGWVPEVSAMGVVLIIFAVVVVALCKVGFSRFTEFGSRA